MRYTYLMGNPPGLGRRQYLPDGGKSGLKTFDPVGLLASSVEDSVVVTGLSGLVSFSCT